MVVCLGVRQLYCWIGGGVLAAAAVTTVVLCAVLIPRHSDDEAGKRNRVRNLLDLTPAERRAFFASFDVVLTDCDGTVWDLTASIPGANAGVAALQALPKRVVFVSNNALRSDENYLQQFRHENISATMADVMHPGVSIVDYLQQQQFDGLIYAIGSPNLRKYLLDAGHRLVPAETREQLPAAFSILDRYAHDDLPVAAVVLDFDVNMEMKELLRAEAYLNAREDCVLLAGATDDRIPFAKPTMGPGPIIRLLEQVTGRKATAVGKPGEAMRTVAMKKFGVEDARRILFIGDTLEQDIGFGNTAGFQTLAVLTGAASLESIAAERNASWVPDFYVPSFADFVELCRDA